MVDLAYKVFTATKARKHEIYICVINILTKGEVTESWTSAKVFLLLFVFLFVCLFCLFYGPRLSRSLSKLLKEIEDESNIQPSLPHAWSITHISWPNKLSQWRICYTVKTICILAGQSGWSRGSKQSKFQLAFTLLF